MFDLMVWDVLKSDLISCYILRMYLSSVGVFLEAGHLVNILDASRLSLKVFDETVVKPIENSLKSMIPDVVPETVKAPIGQLVGEALGELMSPAASEYLAV